MKTILALAALALAAPVIAQTHEPLAGALSGRSPHTTMRPVAAAAAACGTAPTHATAGRQPTATPAARPCAPALSASRTTGTTFAVGR